MKAQSDPAYSVDTMTVTIEPYSAQDPVADAGPDQDVLQAVVGDDVIVNFDGTGSYDPDGVINSYTWDFGDSSSGSVAEPQHIYTPGTISSPVTYTVTLTVEDDFTPPNSVTDTMTVTIIPADQADPVASIAGLPKPLYVNDPVYFDGSASYDPDGGDIVSYLWVWDDDTEDGSGPDPTHTYTSADTYMVTLTVWDNDGRSGTDTVTFTVQEKPVEMINVLFLEAGGGYNELIGAVKGMPFVNNLELFSGYDFVPKVEDLLIWDVVIVTSIAKWSDSVATGDVLAEYVDQGGKVLMLGATIYGEGGYSIAGRIAEDPNYSPIPSAEFLTEGTSVSFISHPITQDVYDITTNFYAGTKETQGPGEPLGYYDDGSLIGAYNPDKPIVVINVMPFDGLWKGDFLKMVENALAWLGQQADRFDIITRADIAAFEEGGGLTAVPIPFIKDKIRIVQLGDIFLYITKNGLFGKLKVVDYNYDLMINWVTYNPKGRIETTGSGLVISGTWNCDLDKGVQATKGDFWWSIGETGVLQTLVPTNGARFGKW